jgi:hypothetical protein
LLWFHLQKYFLQVCLVQSFSSDALVKKIQAEPLRTAQEVITACAFIVCFHLHLKRLLTLSIYIAFLSFPSHQEDEIEAGAFTLNLKCPVRLFLYFAFRPDKNLSS